MKNKKNRPLFFICERCGKAVIDYEAKYTLNVAGLEERMVCPDCYDSAMKYGYDNEIEICAYEDVEYAHYRCTHR